MENKRQKKLKDLVIGDIFLVNSTDVTGMPRLLKAVVVALPKKYDNDDEWIGSLEVIILPDIGIMVPSKNVIPAVDADKMAFDCVAGIKAEGAKEIAKGYNKYEELFGYLTMVTMISGDITAKLQAAYAQMQEAKEAQDVLNNADIILPPNFIK